MKLRPWMSAPSLTISEAKCLALNFSDAKSLPERISSIDLGVRPPLSAWQTDFLFDYDIFPSHILRFEAEWKLEQRAMRVGDIIVQRAIIPPLGYGLCLEFAVRISQIIQESNRLGFSYETLEGHAERGVAEFYFSAAPDSLAFNIRTLSEPGHWVTRLAKDLATLPYQAWCTRLALAHVRESFVRHNRLQ